MDRKLKVNYVFNLIYQILVLAIPLVTMPYISRVLTPDGVGLNGYINSIAYYFVYLGCLGISLYAQKEIAAHQDDVKERSKIFKEIFILNFLCLLVSTMAYLLITYFFLEKENFTLYLIQGITLIAFMIDVTWYFQGIEEFKKIVFRNSIIKLGALALIFIFIKSSEDVSKYIAINALVILVSNISLWFYLPKYLVKVEGKLNIKRHFLPAVCLFIPQVAISLYVLIDKTMIQWITNNTAEVGYYDNAEKIVKLLLNVLTALSTVVIPRVAKYFADGRDDLIRDQIKVSFKLIWFLSIPIAFGIGVIANNLVPLFLGEEYLDAVNVVIFIAPMIILFAISNLIGAQYLVPTNQMVKYTACVLIGTLANIILNLVFIPVFGGMGAAISTIIAEGIIIFIEVILIKNKFNIKELFTPAIKYFLAAILFIPIAFGVDFLDFGNLVSMAIKMVACALVYCLILLIIRDDLFFEKIKFYYQKIFKRKSDLEKDEKK